MRRQRHAKIVATIGPASSSPERLRELFLAGADVFRLNFSHGTHDDHRRVHAAIRALERETGRPIAILQDLQGPKIRVGLIRDGKIQVSAGETVRFVLGREEGGREAIPLPHPEIFGAILPGAALLVDDGRVRLEAVRVEAETIEARVVVGGMISNRKGVNLPDTALDLSPLTAKDRADLAFGLGLGVDLVALSFVQKPADLIEARALIGERAALVAKVEKPQALGADRGHRPSGRRRSWWPGATSGSRSRTRTSRAGRRSWCSCAGCGASPSSSRPRCWTRWCTSRHRPGPRRRTWRPPSTTAPTPSCCRRRAPRATTRSRRWR